MKTDNLGFNTKVCGSCKEDKHVTEFHARSLSKDGLASVCKKCNLERTNEWALKNVEKRSNIHRKSALKRTYGISLEQYDELLEKQHHCCAICDRHEDEFKTRLAVDHNHKTGEIRGLLCNYCNHRVVGRHTDGDKLRQIADYIEQGTGWFVPKKKRPVKRKPKRV